MEAAAPSSTPADRSTAADSGHATAKILLVSGVTLAALLVAYATVWVNVPARYHPPYGLHPPSLELFRQLWSYPSWRLSPIQFTALASGTLLLAWLAYFVALGAATFAEDDTSGRRGRRILSVCAILSLALVFYFPTVLSADIFHYAMHGRMVSLYGWNPYVVGGDAMRGDPFHALAIWRDIPTQYGPLWTMLAALLTRVGGDHVLVTVLLFKTLAACGHIASAALIWGLARRLPGVAADRALVLYAWNPLLLLESAGSGHNDFVMLALALAGSAAFVSRRFILGLVLLLASAAVKYITLLLAFLLAAHALSLVTTRDRLRAVTTWFVVGMSVIALFYAPFLVGTEGLAHLWAGLAPETNPMPNHVGLALRRILMLPFPSNQATAFANLLLNGLFGIAMLAYGWRCLRPGSTWSGVFAGYAVASFVYAYIVFAGSLPWYLLSPLAAVALAGRGRVPFYLLATLFGLGIGFMLQNVQLLPD